MFFSKSNSDEAAVKIFSDAIKKFPQQVFIMPSTNINLILSKSDEIQDLEKNTLSQEEAWEGFKGKAKIPEFYVTAILKSVILPNSGIKTNYGQAFTRLSIQKSFATGNLVIVKEQVHIIENEKRILFLGLSVDQQEAKALFKEHFKEEYLKENPALFHVEHALEGNEANPVATWQMVRLSEKDATDKEENKLIENLRKLIGSSNGERIYLQTLKQLHGNSLVFDS